MELFIVIVIVGLAAAYIIKTFYRILNKAGGSSCKCSSCDSNGTTCNQPTKVKPYDCLN